MEEFKGTKTEVQAVEYGGTEIFFRIETVEDATDILNCGDISEMEANAELMAQAINVRNRTNLTPEQMAKRISDLEARLKKAVELIEKIKTPWGKTRIGDEITSFLTKEKTK